MPGFKDLCEYRQNRQLTSTLCIDFDLNTRKSVMSIKKHIEAMEHVFHEQQTAALATTANISGDVVYGHTTAAQALALRSSNHQSIEIEQPATHLSGIDALMHLLEIDEEAGEAFDRMVNDKVHIQKMKGNRGIRRSKEHPGVQSPIPDCSTVNREICLLPRLRGA